jgi:succinyl-diaminopimelate desuccinylase
VQPSGVRQLLQRLVAAPSPNPPGDEREVAAVVLAACQELHLPTPRVLTIQAGRPNLVLQVGSGGPPRLLLLGHLDTMPPGDRRQWTSEPFALTEDRGRLVGLGAADMKASVAAALVALARSAPRLREGTVELVLTADEEGGSQAGMQALLGTLLGADHAVVLEPSGSGDLSWQHLYVAELGSCVLQLEARGEAGHSGMRIAAERRASEPFSTALRLLIEQKPLDDLRHPVDGSSPIVNVATMVFGGTTPFAHPDRLNAIVEVRTHEGMDARLVLDRLRHCLRPLQDRVSLDLVTETPPGRACTDSVLLRAASSAWQSVIGTEPKRAVLRAGTDGAYLSEAGVPTLPAFGPGSLGVAHAPNEFVPAEDLDLACDLYEAFLDAYFDQRASRKA